MESPLSRNRIYAFLKDNNTVIRLRKALRQHALDSENDLWCLVDFYFSPEMRADHELPFPSDMPFFDLLFKHFGTCVSHWTPRCVNRIFENHRSHRAHFKIPLVFVLLSLDGECLTWPVVHTMMPMFSSWRPELSLDTKRLRKWLPSAPTTLCLERDILRRLPQVRFTDVSTITTILDRYSSVTSMPPRSILLFFLERIPFQELVTDKLNTAPLSSFVEFVLFSHSDLASAIPDAMKGRVLFRNSTVEAFFLDIEDDFDPYFDEELALHMAELVHPLARDTITAHLLKTREEHRIKLGRELATFYEKYPGQEPETHQCPEPAEGHVCNFYEHENTCRACCMNCLFDHRFEVGGVREHRAYITVCDRLLPFFRAPTKAKRPE